VEAIVAAAREALARRTELAEMIESAAAIAHRHDLRHERAAFLEILDQVEELWAAA
jgi:alkylhydroperoxidase/carboxymuconolactone decarboxylase family protein YurZ